MTIKTNNKDIPGKVGEKVTDKVTDKVTENQQMIIQIIRENKRVTTFEMSKIVKISQRKIKENIAKLKDYGIIERIGPAKGGHWEIVKKYD